MELEKTTITSIGKDEIYCEFFECDKCDNEYIIEGFKYCPGCGRKIKWI